MIRHQWSGNEARCFPNNRSPLGPGLAKLRLSRSLANQRGKAAGSASFKQGYLSRISTFTVPSPVAVLKGLVLVAFIGRIREQGESLETAVYRGTLLRPRPRALLTFAVQSP